MDQNQGMLILGELQKNPKPSSWDAHVLTVSFQEGQWGFQHSGLLETEVQLNYQSCLRQAYKAPACFVCGTGAFSPYFSGH